eukprot:m.160770 g.160770  ORF g.160770 m.160770 type:complete len:142 (+) comp38783_c0_seq3:1351-1776(+)
MSQVLCKGYETNLSDCRFPGWGVGSCGHSQDAGVICRPIVRLVGGSKSSEGRVEVYHHGTWGTVCDDHWDSTDARVVCRELGYTIHGAQSKSASLGQGSGTIGMDNVNCRGSERRLVDCSFSGLGSHNCHHGEDAGVVCVG